MQQGPFRAVTQPQFGELLRGLGRRELIEQMPQGELILAPAGERVTASWDFYAAFQAVEEYQVRCGADPIGTLPTDLIPEVNHCLILGGRRWRVREIVPESKLVLVAPDPGGVAPIFKSSGGEIHTRIMREMQLVLRDSEEPAYLNDEGRLMLRGARRLAQELGLDRGNLLERSGLVQWFPWIGSRGLLTLWLYAKRAGLNADLGRISIIYPVDGAEEFYAHLRQVATWAIDGEELAELLPVKAFEKFDEHVPADLQATAIARDRLAINEAQDAAKALLGSH